MTHRVYGMVHSRPTLLQHEIGFLAANWTTAVIVSEKAALTWVTIPPQLNSSTLNRHNMVAISPS